VFPDVFANLYATGEASGRLDDHLQKLHRYYLDSGMGKLEQLSAWIPKIVYLIIVGFIVKHIFGFWIGYFNEIGKISDGF
jgi:type II secretory pathway component PulF